MSGSYILHSTQTSDNGTTYPHFHISPQGMQSSIDTSGPSDECSGQVWPLRTRRSLATVSLDLQTARVSLRPRPSISKASVMHCLFFERCRKQRRKMVVDRGKVQQYLSHLHDGPEKEERDRKMQMIPTPEDEALTWRDPGLAPTLLGHNHIADVRQVKSSRISTKP